MGIQKFFIILIVVLVSSCLKQSESITPIVQPMTLAELQRQAVVNMASNGALSTNSYSSISLSSDPTIFYLNIKYNIENIDVFSVANMPNTFEQMAHSFLGSVAKIVLSVSGPQKIDLSTISFVVPNLNIDRTMVKSVKIKRVYLQYAKAVDSNSDYAANFSFIDSIDLAQSVTVPKLGTVNTLLLSYQYSRNNCLYKCIDFDIEIDNVLDLMQPNTNIKLNPTLSIAHLPAITDLKLDGHIELEIGLKLPF